MTKKTINVILFLFLALFSLQSQAQQGNGVGAGVRASYLIAPELCEGEVSCDDSVFGAIPYISYSPSEEFSVELLYSVYGDFGENNPAINGAPAYSADFNYQNFGAVGEYRFPAPLGDYVFARLGLQRWTWEVANSTGYRNKINGTDAVAGFGFGFDMLRFGYEVTRIEHDDDGLTMHNIYAGINLLQ